MKPNRLLAAVCVALSLVLFTATFTAIVHTEKAEANPTTAARMLAPLAVGNVQAGMPVLGVSQLVVTGTNALNLASGAASAGTSSVPCNNLTLQIAGTNNTLLMGSSSGTASCTYPLYLNTTSGTAAGNYSYSVPATNLNQIWLYVSSGSATVNAQYAQ